MSRPSLDAASAGAAAFSVASSPSATPASAANNAEGAEEGTRDRRASSSMEEIDVLSAPRGSVDFPGPGNPGAARRGSGEY